MSPSLYKKSCLDPPTFAIKILAHDWSTSPAFFPLLYNQICSTLSVGGEPIAIEIHPTFLVSYPNSLITHADSTPILFDRSVALAASTSGIDCSTDEMDFFEEEESKSELPKCSLQWPKHPYETFSDYNSVSLNHKDPSANIMIIAR